MKDIMQKLSELEATAPKTAKKKMLKEDSATPPINAETKPTRLKDIFETMATKDPIPVVGKEGGTQSTGAGFINVTDTSPAAQALGKAVGDLAAQKKLQIVVPNQPGTAPAAAGATGQAPMGATAMREKWDAETKVAPSEKGKYAGKDKAELTKAYNKLKASGPHKKGSPEFGKMRELAFAIRAKSDWGKVQEEDMDEGLLGKAALGLAGAAALAGGAQAASPGKTRIDPVNPHSSITRVDPSNPKSAVTRVDPVNKKSVPVRIDPVNKRSIPVRVDLEEKLTKSMSAGDIISDFEKSKDPKFKGKSKEERKKQALGAYYSMHPEKSKKKKTDEADIPSTQGIDTKGAGLGAGRSQTTLEAKEPQVEVIDNAFNRENYKDLIGKKYPKSKAPAYARVKEISEGAKPDFLDLDKDGNKKEPMKKAAADKKKQKVKESMNHRISAARLEGKSHGLRGHAHSGKRYEDLEELKAYHEGYKEGLDECYGQGVYEAAPATPPATVGGMADAEMEEGKLGKAALALGGAAALATGAGIGKNIYDYHKKDASGYSQSDVDKIMGTDSRRSAYDREQERRGNYRFEEDEMEEGNLFTGNLAKARAAGKKEADLDGDGDMEKVKETAFAFEAWDKQLKALINESSEVNEGMSVSISKGQQNSPDSVTITAQDHEADELLAFVKQAGLGLFGADKEPSSAMSIQPASHGAPDEVGAGGVDIDVVDGDDMLSLMKKISGVEASGSDDYADEEGHKDCGCSGDCDCNEKTDEATCNECGMMEGMHEAGCSMGKGKEVVDEVESEDQQEFEVAEDNAPDSETAEHNADEDAEAEEDAALAKAAQQNKTTTVNEDGDEASEEGPESKEGEGDEGAETVSESFANLFRKLSFIAEESTEKEDEKAEKAGKKVAKDIEHDEGHKGKDDDKAEKAGKKVTKDIEYDDKKDKKEKVDEWANQVGKGPGKGTDASFEQDIDFMTKVIAGGLNKPKSTGQTTIPVIAGQDDRMHDNPQDWATLAGIKK